MIKIRFWIITFLSFSLTRSRRELESLFKVLTSATLMLVRGCRVSGASTLALD